MTSTLSTCPLRFCRRRPGPALIALFVATLAPFTAVAADWPNWRGPAHSNTSPEINLPEEWSPRGGAGSNLLWKSEALGSRSTPVVLDGRLYTLVRNRPGTALEGEKVVCADAATGEVLWEHAFNVYLSDVPDTRVAWSSVVGDPETGRVYAQGVCGYFCCLEGESGGVVWERSLHEELGLLSTYGGRTNYPLIYKDTVITSAVVIGWGDDPQWGLLAKPAHRFMGFDKATGELRWLSGTNLIPYDTTYSTPVLTNIGGQDVMVFGSGDGCVWALQAATGKRVWSYPLSRRGINTPPVVADDGMVYVGHSEENTVGTTMGALVAIDGTKAGTLQLGDERWIQPEDMVGRSAPMVIDGIVYAVTDTAKLLSYDAESGQQTGRKTLGRGMRATLLYADGKFYAGTNEGMFYVLKPEGGRVDTLMRIRMGGEQIDASPIVANGRIYVTTSDAVYCIGNEESIAANKDTVAQGFEPSDAPAGAAAQIMLSPYDSLLKPGEPVQFRVRLFDANGQMLADPPADAEIAWSVAEGPGEVTPGATALEGEFLAPADASHECSLIVAQMGDLRATARVRIVPPLPWDFAFEGVDDVPLTWVGGRIRYNLREEEGGNHYIAKPTELPTRPGAPTTKLGTRSQMWMGSADMANYTVQADVQMQTGFGGESSGPAPEFPVSSGGASVKLPSLGLINSRYTFTLNGPNSKAELYSWCTHDKRTQAAKAMEFEPGVWYTMKLRVAPDPEAGLSHVAAKVWRRGGSEPSEWTLEFDDKAPNYEGSPGLFGDSKEAEFYVDNLTVTPND